MEMQMDYTAEVEEIESRERAEDHLRSIGRWEFEKQGILEHAQAEMDKIAIWEAAELEKVESKIEWHKQGLQAFLWRTGEKTVKLINGTLKRIKGRERIDIVDEALFLAKAPEELVAVKRSPDKKAIMAQIKAGGEIPEGADIVTGEDSFSVTV